jgi:RNA polymerase sigma-70 factor (ECF subfamily)
VRVEGDRPQDPAPEDGPDIRAIFEDLYRNHFEAIYAYVLRRVSRADTADLVADVFATAWRRIDDVPPGLDSKMWLYGVARRIVRQHYRSKGRADRLKSKLLHNAPPVTPGDQYESSDLDTQVRRLIESLKDDDRELVTLIVWDGLTHAEVAMILECTANAVAIRWHRALKRLRRHIEAVTADPANHSNPPLVQPLTEES